jgi:uncharacterized protein (DUF302 family)
MGVPVDPDLTGPTFSVNLRQVADKVGGRILESSDARRRITATRTMAASSGAGLPMPSDRSAHSNGSDPRGAADDQIVVTKASPWSMADTVARLCAVVAARGLKVFAVIDHSDEARLVGLALRDTKLFIVGSPKVTTPLIEAAPLAALDLPLRVIVWEDGYQTKVSYPSPAVVARRYGLDADLAAALESIDAWTSTVIDR